MTPRVDHKQLEEFNRKLVQAAKMVCPKYGVDIHQCVLDAAKATCWGKFALHNNYFDMDGSGDMGHNYLMRALPTGKVKDGGLQPTLRSLARFSSPAAAVKEYCIRKLRSQNHVG